MVAASALNVEHRAGHFSNGAPEGRNNIYGGPFAFVFRPLSSIPGLLAAYSCRDGSRPRGIRVLAKRCKWMKDTKLNAISPRAVGLGCCTLLLCAGIVSTRIVSARQMTPQAAPTAQAAGAASSGGLLQEVIVTAERQAEPLQNVPMSITALTGAVLQNLGAMSLADISRAVPGLSVFSVGPGQNIINIRGISSAGGSAPTVGFYIDDTPIPNGSAGYDPDPVLFDLARVEVLEGPQGTLYGGSSMGGTVRYITRQPNLDAFEATAKATGSFTEGGGLNNEYDGMINLPLSSAVALRASATYRNYSGYIDRAPIDSTNILQAQPDSPVAKDVNTESTLSARVALEFKPLPSLTFTPWMMYQRTLLGAPFTFDEPPGSFDHSLQVRDTSEPISSDFTLVALPVNATVGRIHLTSNTSYYDSFFEAVEDESKVDYFYFSPAPQAYVYPSPFWNDYHQKQFTEEARAAGTAGPVRGLIGAYYSHVDNPAYFFMPILPGYNAAFGTPFGNTQFYTQDAGNHTEDLAAFGQFDLSMTHALQLTLGDRVFEHKDASSNVGNGVFNGGPVGGPEVYHTRENGNTPKVVVSYHLTPNAMVYANAAKGYRPGATGAGVPAAICSADLAAIDRSAASTGSYDPDTLWDYELGEKATSEALGLSVDSAVYYMKWKDLQQLLLLPICGFDFTGNFGSAVSKGAELQVHYAVSRALLVSVSGSFTQAQLASTVAGAQGMAGDPLENVPKWTGSLDVDYQRPIHPGMNGFAHLDMSTSSRQYNNFVPTSIYYDTGGYTLANARVGINTGDWQVAFFVSNLLNKHAETALPNSYAINLPDTRMVSLNRPRTVGLSLQREF
jgi:iron complex outermembrane recepter protein